MDIIPANTVIAVEEIAASAVDDWEFIRLQDQAPGDIPEEYEAELTRGDVVDIFASIFGRGACGAADDPDSYSGPVDGETPQESAASYLTQKYAGVTGAQQLAAEFGLGDLCLPETLDGGEIERPVYLHASSEWIFDEHAIVSYDAKMSDPTYLEQDIYLRVEFSNTSYAPIYYYVDLEKYGKYKLYYDHKDLYEWRGTVKDEEGNTVESPVFTVENGRVYFPGNWSGIIIFKRLPIKYIYHTLTISGTVGADATRQYNARVSAKAAGLDAVHLDISEEIRAEETKEKCPWLDFDFGPNGNGTGIETTCGKCEEPEEPEDPDPEPPTTCDSSITAEEYKEECCGGPLTDCLPPCRSITTTVQGPIAGEEPDEYCGKTEVIVLMPEDGNPCGRLTKSWYTDPGNCCPKVSLEYSDSSPTIIVGSATVYFLGGRLPITVNLSGQGFYLSPSDDITELVVENRSVTIYERSSCGNCEITGDDGCTTALGHIRSSTVVWTVIEDTIQDGFGLVTCEDGKYRYSDDVCQISPSTCTGYGQKHCTWPAEYNDGNHRSEGNLVEIAECP